MVWACGKNGWLPYGQKGVDGRSQWEMGARQTKVSLDGWCEVALGKKECRWRLRDNARTTRKRGEPWYICNWISFTQPSLLGPVFFWTALPCSGGYHMERGGMPLHDAVGINCKKGCNYWKSRLSCQVYGLMVYLDDCVCFYLTWHDYPSLV